MSDSETKTMRLNADELFTRVIQAYIHFPEWQDAMKGVMDISNAAWELLEESESNPELKPTALHYVKQAKDAWNDLVELMRSINIDLTVKLEPGTVNVWGQEGGSFDPILTEYIDEQGRWWLPGTDEKPF